MEVIGPSHVELDDKEVQVRLSGPTQADLGSSAFGPFGIAGRFQATLMWVWDTAELQPGSYSLAYTIQPDGPSWSEAVTLLPDGERPEPEAGARWETVASECCLIHYITGTASARDIQSLTSIADEQAGMAARRMGIEFGDPITITLLPRVLGHGGFAGGEIYVAYLDRNYAGSNFAQVLHHEMVHILDGRLGGELRPSLLVEGLAVYLTGGHFKLEPLMVRAAALVDLGLYLPLAPLIDEFYTSQHEIGYLQGGALVQYMLETWGWPAFDGFYRDIAPHASGRQSEAIGTALRAHFGLTLEQLENNFLAELRRRHINPDMRADVLVTIEYYDTVRRYQQGLDTSAYFLTAWLPGGEDLRQKGIVADYLRHPQSPENIALEALLVNADNYLRAGDYAKAGRALAAANAVLRALEAEDQLAFDRHPLAADYLAIASQFSAQRLSVNRIMIEGETAQVWASTTGQEIVEVGLIRSNGGWQFLSSHSAAMIAGVNFDRLHAQALFSALLLVTGNRPETGTNRTTNYWCRCTTGWLMPQHRRVLPGSHK